MSAWHHNLQYPKKKILRGKLLVKTAKSKGLLNRDIIYIYIYVKPMLMFNVEDKKTVFICTSEMLDIGLEKFIDRCVFV